MNFPLMTDGRPTGIIDSLEQRLTHYDHFTFVNDEDWVLTADATPVFQAADRSGGWLQFATDAANDNDEAYASTGENILFTAGKPVYIGCKIRLSEANTDDANWLFGLTDQGGANTLQDNGAGPPASYSGAVIFKVDGTMTIRSEERRVGKECRL